MFCARALAALLLFGIGSVCEALRLFFFGAAFVVCDHVYGHVTAHVIGQGL
jgi:hypothetical protein